MPHSQTLREAGRPHPAKPNSWAIVPAAGIGRRMGGATPKQYLPLNGVPILGHTLTCLATHPGIRGVVVALAADDPWWPTLSLSVLGHSGNAPIYAVEGGPERGDSVLNALRAATAPAMAMAIGAGEGDWVLVHDAVRPCLRHEDIDRLMAAVWDHPVGGLLGMRVRDTMKRTDGEGSVTGTVDREGLWHALTPQMFRLGALRDALTGCIGRGITVTDEAQAMELAAGPGNPMPCIVEGSADNIKVTTPADLALAEFYLRSRATARKPMSSR